jgi:hypothetical protein
VKRDAAAADQSQHLHVKPFIKDCSFCLLGKKGMSTVHGSELEDVLYLEFETQTATTKDAVVAPVRIPRNLSTWDVGLETKAMSRR